MTCGHTFTIYSKGNSKAMKQVEQMRADGRVDMYAEANYEKDTTAYIGELRRAQLMNIFGSDVKIKAVKVDINNEDEYILTGVNGNTISFSDYSTGEFQNSLNYIYLIKPSQDVVNPVFFAGDG